MNALPGKLVDYEGVIRAAAQRQVAQHQRRRRRLATTIALAVPACGVAGVAGAQIGVFSPLESQFGILRDAPSPTAAVQPGDPQEVAKLSIAAGAGPRDSASARQWTVAGHRAIGYTAANGDFCWELVNDAGGCLQPGTLSDDLPLSTINGYGPGAFTVFGLAIDDVVSVSITVGSTHGQATMGPNSFYYSNPSLGGSTGFHGTVTATLKDGTTRSIPIHMSPDPAFRSTTPAPD